MGADKKEEGEGGWGGGGGGTGAGGEVPGAKKMALPLGERARLAGRGVTLREEIGLGVADEEVGGLAPLGSATVRE